MRWLSALLMPLLLASCAAAPKQGQSAAIEQVERLARTYYDHMQALDYPAMRALSTPQLEVLSQSTPEFEIFGEGLRIGHQQFEQQIAQTKQADRKLRFQLTQFRTVVTPNVAYTSYMLHITPDNKTGTGEMVWRRERGQWLLDRLTHMPFYPGYPQ